MEWLLDFDRSVFNIINKELSNSAFDWFFILLTDFHKTMVFWIALPLFLLWFLWRYRRYGGLVIIGLLVSLLANDGLGGKIIKPLFGRLRPNLSDPSVILRAPHFGGFSFISNHASNMFCLALFVGYFFPRSRLPLLILAGLVAFSRVYVGVHFPSDVVGGAIIGSLIGYFSAKMIGSRIIKVKVEAKKSG